MTGPSIGGARHYFQRIHWDDELDKFVVGLATAGHSMAEISLRVRRDFCLDCSRNCVVGRLQRLKFKSPHRASAAIRKAVQNRKPRAEKIISISKPLPLPDILDDTSQASISALQAKDIHCAWIVGDPRQLKRCSNIAVRGHSWCILHIRRVFADVKNVRSGAVTA